jgi:serine/threonine protein kinase
MIGQTIAHYKITAKLGEGGMGEVYLATDTSLDRQVALKFLPGALQKEPEARERLVREAKAASKLHHPNILTIYAVEQHDGRDFIVMEYVDGASLDQYRIAPGRAFSELLDVSLQIAEGLAAAHSAGVIHRDLKPSNVIVDRSGRARILDFGLAVTGQDARLTREGTLIGSPAYMSPEQVRGLAVDHRSDIFSFGVLLYELLSGTHPFWADQEAAILYAIVNELPEPLDARVNVLSEDWNTFIDACLAKDPAARVQTAPELVSALRDLILGSGQFPTSSQWSRSLFIRDQSTIRMPSTVPSVAVLPFVDLSPAKDQEYFCDGLAEELINALSGISGLRVVARTSAFSFKGQNLDVRTIGSKLGVTSVLEGSVRKQGDRLRITAQLINVADGYQLWSERFDCDAGDVFAIQDEIAKTVAERLRVKLGSLPSAPTHDVEAYNLYLQGRFHWNKRTNESMHKALGLFEAAIARDPEFALAYAGVADSLLILEDHGFIGHKDAIAKARSAVDKALSLDPDSAEALTGLGGIHSELREFGLADRAFRRAIQLKPGYATAHHWYSTQMLLEVGNIDEAGREMLKARELDPLSLIINTDLARHYYYVRDFAKARETVGYVLSLDPHFIKAQRLLFLTLWQMGDHGGAIAHIPEWLPPYAGLQRDDNDWSQILAEHHREGVLRRLLMIMEQSKGGYPLHYARAAIHAQLGEPDLSVNALQENINSRSANLSGLHMDGMLDPIRSHPRFVELLKSLGI